jgi:hypothetical protein
MRRLLAAGLLPERAGQAAKVWAHISLADLLAMDGSSALQEEWIARARAQWAAARAAASVGGSDGAAWLEGDAARAFACDASITPVVTGEVNHAVLDHLVRLCLELAGHGNCGHRTSRDGTGEDGTGPEPASSPEPRTALEPVTGPRPRLPAAAKRSSRPSSAKPCLS